MRWRLMPILFFIFLCSSFVFAGVSLDSISSVGSGGSVTVSGTCDSSPVLLQAVAGLSTVWLDEVDMGPDNTFSTTFTPDGDGTYTIYAACGGESTNLAVCVGDSCSDLSSSDSDSSDSGSDSSGSDSSSSSTSSSSSSSSGGGGGGRRCRESWTCDDWSYCGSSLTQTRECYDENNCRTETDKPNVTQACDTCVESWVCESWSECSDGKQIRSCADEHKCGTYQLRPDETQECKEEGFFSFLTDTTKKEATTEYEYVYLESDSFSAKLIKSTKAFLANNWLLLILGLVGLLILVLAIVFFIKYKHKHTPAENTDELEIYVKEELAAGMSKEQIEKNLEGSGWDKEEIEEVLAKIPSSAPSFSTPSTAGVSEPSSSEEFGVPPLQG